MNSGSGIQELMAAETRASQIVAEARIGALVVAALSLSEVVGKIFLVVAVRSRARTARDLWRSLVPCHDLR